VAYLIGGRLLKTRNRAAQGVLPHPLFQVTRRTFLVPIDRLPQSVFERYVCTEAKKPHSSASVQCAARLAIGVVRVPNNFSVETRQSRYQRRQISDADFHA
jgi:hypothetical protein